MLEELNQYGRIDANAHISSDAIQERHNQMHIGARSARLSSYQKCVTSRPISGVTAEQRQRPAGSIEGSAAL